MAIFIYNKEASDPEFDQYGIYDCRDQKIYYCTAEELINYQNEGYIIDGLPKEVRVVKKTANLQKAKKAKNDEFYTQLSDIEKELMNYDPAIFKDKVIYCPTDVAYAQGRILPSEFVHYFQMNAKRLGFKKLIATCLAEKVDNNEKVYNRYEFTRRLRPECDPNNSFYNEKQQKYYPEDLPDEVYYYDDEGKLLDDSDKLDMMGDTIKKQIAEAKENYLYEKLKKKRETDLRSNYESRYVIDVRFSECEPDEDGKYGSGDFRSKECTEILKKSDIVVTNPPFSLFREFIAWLKQDDGTLKPCILVGSQNAIQLKEVFPLIRDNILSTGYTGFTPDMYYSFPEDLRYTIKDSDIERAHAKGFTGNVTRMGNTCWFTTEKYKNYKSSLFLYEHYYEEDGVTPLPDSSVKYPKYDDYDAINVDKIKSIPIDYYGVMGVPITFIDKYDPTQFDIVAFRKDENNVISVYTRQEERESLIIQSYQSATQLPGMIKNAEGKINGRITYGRVTIRRKLNQ